MTAQAAGSSAPLERDARNVNAHSAYDHQVRPADIAVGVIIGRTSEFFDFFVYAIASVIVFPAVVFPFVDRLTGTLYSFAFFALAFIARPFGSIIFMTVDRLYGRGTKLTIALFLLGSCTVALAFLPSYAQIGAFSLVLLAMLRIGQGLALGGAWDGLASLLALNAPPKHRGWWAMIPQLGAPIGLFVASGLFAFLIGNMAATDFLGWGWRYPFFVAFSLNVVALFARLRIVVTSEYESLFTNRELQPSPILPTLKRDGRSILLGAFLPLASFALFHLVTVFPLSWVSLYTRQAVHRFLVIEMVASAFCLAAVVASGLIADRIGRRTLLGWGAAAIALFSIACPVLLGGGEAEQTVFMVLGFVLLGLSFGQSSGSIASNFRKGARYTGSALTSDLAWLVGAGFAPLLALLLATRFGLVAAGAYLFSGAVATLIALYINKELAQRLD